MIDKQTFVRYGANAKKLVMSERIDLSSPKTTISRGPAELPGIFCDGHDVCGSVDNGKLHES